MLASWLVFPLLLGVLALGCGLFVEAVGGVRFAAGLVIPLGFTVIIVVASAVTLLSGLWPLASSLVVALAAGGVWLRRERIGLPPPWLTGATVVVFLVYAAPVLFSGEPTFAGYTRLDDASTFLALTARLVDHGRDLVGVAPSTYARTLHAYLGTGYPVGSLVPLGVVAPLVGTNLAWLFQPYLTFLAALLAMCLWALSQPLAGRPALRFALVIVAAQPALLYAYANEEGAVKEMTMVVLVPLAAALAARLVRRELTRGAVIAAVITGVALLDTYSLGALPWLGPLGLAAVVSLVVRRSRPSGRRPAAAAVLGGMGLAGVLAVTSVETIGSFARSAGDLRSTSIDLGNLYRPLSPLQVFGVWPTGDFRLGIGGDASLAGLLIAAVAAMSVLGLRHAVRERAWELVLYAVSGLAAFLVVNAAGSAWVTAKAMAVVSPAAVLMAGVGLLWWGRPGARVAAALVACGIAVGVLWSNVLAYRGVALAPRDRLAELAGIGRDFASQGPALLNEYEPYGARFFLRALDAEAPAELRVRPVYLRDGSYLPKAQVADLDRFALSSLAIYRTIIVRRSPAESRPPATFELKRVYTYYEVWQQAARPPALLADLPLRRGIDPASVPDCRQVAALARSAAAVHGRLIGAPGTLQVAAALTSSTHPASWSVAGDAEHLAPAAPGVAALALSVPHAGEYSAWLGGSFGRGVALSVDGRPVGALRHELNFTGQYGEFGRVALTAGSHMFRLSYTAAGLHPGDAGRESPLGPLVLEGEPRPGTALISVSPAGARGLCGRLLDWIEVVRPAA